MAFQKVFFWNRVSLFRLDRSHRFRLIPLPGVKLFCSASLFNFFIYFYLFFFFCLSLSLFRFLYAFFLWPTLIRCDNMRCCMRISNSDTAVVINTQNIRPDNHNQRSVWSSLQWVINFRLTDSFVWVDNSINCPYFGKIIFFFFWKKNQPFQELVFWNQRKYSNWWNLHLKFKIFIVSCQT